MIDWTSSTFATATAIRHSYVAFFAFYWIFGLKPNRDLSAAREARNIYKLKT